jgi:hypothetical protein
MSKLLRILAIVGLILVGLLLVIRVVGSPIATRMVNRKLAELPDYMGNVGGVHLALWRGTVTVTDFALFRRGQEAAGPVVVVRQASLALAILPLFTGKVGGHGTVDGVEVVILKTEPDSRRRRTRARPLFGNGRRCCARRFRSRSPASRWRTPAFTSPIAA